MKKKIFKTLRVFSYLMIGCFALNLVFIGLLSHMKYSNKGEESIDPETKKFLFHLFGIQNMKPEDKIAFLEQSEDFKENFTGPITLDVANKILPDQDSKYAVDSNFVKEFHLKHWNPDIRINFRGEFRDYWTPSGTIYLCPFDSKGNIEKIPLTSYFAEITHSDQLYEAPFDFEYRSLKGIVESGFLSLITGRSLEATYNVQYSKPGSLEYEAHRVRQDKLIENYTDHRCKIFGDEIDAVEKEIIKAEQKSKQKNLKSAQKWRLESTKLQARRDSLVKGPLFIW